MCLAVTCQLDCTVSAPLYSVSSACRLCGQLQSARLQLVSSAVNVKCQLGRALSAWLPSVSSSAHRKLICSLPSSRMSSCNGISSAAICQLSATCHGNCNSQAQLNCRLSTWLHTCNPATSFSQQSVGSAAVTQHRRSQMYSYCFSAHLSYAASVSASRTLMCSAGSCKCLQPIIYTLK